MLRLNRVIRRRNKLLILIKGMVFAIGLMSFSTSCCVTGHCQISTADVPQEQKEIIKK